MNKYIVWCLELGSKAEDGKTIKAPDAEEAAKAWAEHDDYSSGEYWIANDGTATVIVRHVDSGVDTKFFVTGEMVAQYSAEEAK